VKADKLYSYLMLQIIILEVR